MHLRARPFPLVLAVTAILTACGGEHHNACPPGPPDAAEETTGGVVDVDALATVVQQPRSECPGIKSFSISPASVLPNQQAQLTLSTVGPTPLITWSVTPASGGTFMPSANDPSPTFLCALRGAQVKITAAVGLPDSGLCAGVQFAELSGWINCE